jgi:hypothetical protein
MTYTLTYRSSRVEVLRFYWRMWHAKFWRLHVFIACVAAATCVNAFDRSAGVQSYVMWFCIALPLVTLGFAMWPQIKFKPQERKLEVGPDGWSTRIGNQSGSRPWSGVSSVEQKGNTVRILSTTGNALIVPRRAFEDTAQMNRFLEDAQAWHRGYTARPLA